MEIKFCGGIVRWTSAGAPYLLDDANHTPVNINTSGMTAMTGGYSGWALTTGGGTINVPFGFTYTDIGTFFAVPDDGLVGAGKNSGASCGLSSIDIAIGNSSGALSPTSITDTSANVNFGVWGMAEETTGGGGSGVGSHRYWCLENTNSSNQTWHNEIELHTSSGQITLTAGMLSNSGSGFGSFSAANCVNGNTSSTDAFWLNPSSTGNRIKIDLGSAMAVNKVVIWSSSGCNDIFTVKYSDDGTAYTAVSGSLNTSGAGAPHQSYITF